MASQTNNTEISETPILTQLNVETGSNEEKGKTYRQFIAGGSANIMGIILGLIIGWTSPSLAHLDKGNPFLISIEENSWISSLMPLAAIFGPWAAGFTAQSLGRRTALLIVAFPITISYILLAIAESVWVLYLGRIIGGFGLGWSFTVMPMYVSEVAEKQYRGSLGSMIQFSIGVGLLFDYAVGPYVEFKWLSVASIAFPVLFLVIFFFLPESPFFLLQKERESDARKALMWLRGKSSEGVMTELKIIKTEVEDDKENSTGGLKDIINVRTNRKAIGICVSLLFFQQFSGINVVLFNAQSIFDKAGGSMTADVSTIITGVVCLLAAFPTPFLVERLGRKILLFASAVGMAISLGVLGLCFFLDEHDVDTSSFSVLPIISVLVYLFSYSVAFGPLPWTVMAEMYPGNIRALGSTITASIAWFFAFLVTRFFNDLLEAIGNGWTFWIFAICCVAAGIFVYFILPETKGKTVAEIHKEL